MDNIDTVSSETASLLVTMARTAALSAMRTAIATLLRAVLLGAVLATAFWGTVAGTRRWRLDAYWRSFPPDFGCDETVLVDACTASQLAYMWAVPLAAALASTALLALRAALRRPASAAARARAGRLLPPRAFWAAGCGGMSAADASFLLGYVSVSALWLAVIMARYQTLLPLFKRAGSTPAWAIEWELVSVALGALLFPNLLLLFWPVSRGSVVLQALNLSYPEAIRYHRWIGHFTMTIVAAHSLGFWAVWALRGVWLREALATDARINNLAGGLSFLGGLALWVTSLESCRRSAYALFYGVHHLGFWAFLLAGCMHYQGMFWYCLPGLLLYAVDGAYRATQGAWDGGKALLVAAAAATDADGGGVCALTVAAARYGAAPTGFAWLHVPAASRLQWHPFEYVVAGRSASGAPLLTMHVKAYGRWTRQVVQLAATQGPRFAIALEGPYPELPAPPHHGRRAAGAPAAPGGFSGLVFVAGGIGATAALSVLHELGPEGGKGLPALLLWAVRHPSELRLLALPLLAAARSAGLQLTVRLFYTGPLSTLAAAALASAAAGGAPEQPPPAKTFQLLLPQQPAQPSAAWDEPRAGLASPLSPPAATVAATTPLCPVVAASGLWWQAQEKGAVHAAVFAAALAVMLAVRWVATVQPAAASANAWGTTRAGAAYVIGIAVCSVLAGVTVVQLSTLLCWWSRPRSRTTGAAGSADGVAEPLLSGEAADSSDGKSAAFAEVVAVPAAPAAAAEGATGEGLRIELGRPELVQLLGSWLAALRSLPSADAAASRPAGRREEVGVYAMGPEGLVAAARLLCDAHNAGLPPQPAGVPWLVYQQRTHEL